MPAAKLSCPAPIQGQSHSWPTRAQLNTDIIINWRYALLVSAAAKKHLPILWVRSINFMCFFLLQERAVRFRRSCGRSLWTLRRPFSPWTSWKSMALLRQQPANQKQQGKQRRVQVMVEQKGEKERRDMQQEQPQLLGEREQKSSEITCTRLLHVQIPATMLCTCIPIISILSLQM